MKKNYNFKNILMINYGGIGDEILFLPTIHSIKQQYPKAKITLALEPRSKVIKNLTEEIDEIIPVDIKAKGIFKYLNMLKFIFSCRFKGFDCVVSSGKSPLVAIILFLTGIKFKVGYNSKFGFLLSEKVDLKENQYAGGMYHDLAKPIVETKYENPKIEVKDEEFSLPKELEKNSYIALHPGVSKMSISKNILKCPKISFWKDLILGLLEKGQKVLLLGTNDDKDLIEEILKIEKIKNNPNFINYFNKTKNIKEMAYLMKFSKAVVCVDSAPLHVAVSVGAKIFAIFGPTNEEKLVPKEENIEIIKADCSCRPCLWHKRSENCEKSDCLNINPCLIIDKIN